MMSATSGARLYEIEMDSGRIGASKIIISPVKLLPRTWAGMPKMSFRKSRDSYIIRVSSTIAIDDELKVLLDE